MAYDEALAERIREVLDPERDVQEKKMFGGLAFLINGHMAVAAASKGELMVRCDPERAEELVDDVHVERMVMRNRPMNGWLLAHACATGDDTNLKKWVDVGVSYVKSLPPKAK